jgi:short subunit dehydrogenase-like uncharacterized protein
VKTNTHHLDVSGEPEYLEKIQYLYDDKAVETNTLIVGSCGFDSVPADLGIAFTKTQFSGDLAYVESFLTLESNGGVSYYKQYLFVFNLSIYFIF